MIGRYQQTMPAIATVMPDGNGYFTPCPELLTEDELVLFLRIAEVTSSRDHHNVIEHLKRYRNHEIATDQAMIEAEDRFIHFSKSICNKINTFQRSYERLTSTAVLAHKTVQTSSKMCKNQLQKKHYSIKWAKTLSGGSVV